MDGETTRKITTDPVAVRRESVVEQRDRTIRELEGLGAVVPDGFTNLDGVLESLTEESDGITLALSGGGTVIITRERDPNDGSVHFGYSADFGKMQ